MRKSWNEYFMEIAFQVATRSTCVRRHVGGIAVKDSRILATGYNGVPKGLPHCTDVGCYRAEHNIPSGTHHEFCRGIHAEQNIIVQAAIHGISLVGSTIYLTNTPCLQCTKMLINIGIDSIYYRDMYPDELALDMLKAAHIPLIQI